MACHRPDCRSSHRLCECCGARWFVRDHVKAPIGGGDGFADFLGASCMLVFRVDDDEHVCASAGKKEAIAQPTPWARR